MKHRRGFVGGNWKSNGTVNSITQLVNSLKKDCTRWDPKDVEVILAPSFIHMALTQQLIGETPAFGLSAQNVSKFGPGAFTGEVAAEIISDAGVHWTLVGHSERRHKFGETLEDTAKKIAVSQAAGLGVIFCSGELLEERKAGRTIEVCTMQIDAVIASVKDWSKVVIAYEPVWAIGTGVVATTDQAQGAHASVRALIAEKVSSAVAGSVRILYGGSVTPENCQELMRMPDVDGFLVGGASLKPSFTDIIVAAASQVQ